MLRRSILLICGIALVAAVPVVAQQRDTTNQPPPRSDRSPGESSSKDNPVDLSPPMGDAKSHPNSGIADDVLELHPYDPHKAEKNVEVGDYYFKLKNYHAAESRYREALEYKPNDAIATFKLAVALEKVGDLPEAEKYYSSYLDILPHGPEAEESKASLERLKNPGSPQAKAEDPKKSKKKK